MYKNLYIEPADKLLDFGQRINLIICSDVFLEIEIVDEDVAFNSKVLIVNKVKYSGA